jgi:hypothetical protein
MEMTTKTSPKEDLRTGVIDAKPDADAMYKSLKENCTVHTQYGDSTPPRSGSNSHTLRSRQ